MRGPEKSLPPWAQSYIRRAFKLRRQLNNKNLMRKFDRAQSTISAYGLGTHKVKGSEK